MHFHGRALNTIHEALSISGGLFLDIHHSRSHLYSPSHSIQIFYIRLCYPILSRGLESVSYRWTLIRHSGHLTLTLIFFPGSLL